MNDAEKTGAEQTDASLPDQTTSPALEPWCLEITPGLLAPFTKAETLIREKYGRSPSAIELGELWAAKATLRHVYREFVEIIDSPCDLLPNEEGIYDESCLGFDIVPDRRERGASEPIIEKLRRRYGR